MASAAALAGRGTAVSVFTTEIESAERFPGVTLYSRPQLLRTDAPMGDRIGELPSDRPQIVHLHQVDDPEIVETLRAQAPVVISAHGYTACTAGVHYFRPGQECTRAHGRGCVPNLIARGCAHTFRLDALPARYRHAVQGFAALHAADLAVSYSTAVDRHLATNGVRDRIVVPYFPTMSRAYSGGHATRRRVVFAGRVVSPKGVGVLIRAARHVEAELVVCGDGWQLAAMRRLARRLGVADRVRFMGWLDPEQLARELAEASVLALPSLWPEPFGLVGIEALAAGRPVVASATGGVRDWLDDGVSGLCVKPGDVRALARALAELLADPARQEAMGMAGKAAVAARFSHERHLAALLEGYERARSRWSSERGGGAARAPMAPSRMA